MPFFLSFRSETLILGGDLGVPSSSGIFCGEFVRIIVLSIFESLHLKSFFFVGLKDSTEVYGRRRQTLLREWASLWRMISARLTLFLHKGLGLVL